MARQYSPKRFFRQVPNQFLKQYFLIKNLLAELDFDALAETDATPIYEAWLVLPEVVRNDIEQDFQQIDEMATESGSKAILDEANWHGENLAEQFAELNSFHEHAFWTFLSRPDYWSGATAFNHADTIPMSYWRKRKNIPSVAVHVDDASLQLFENMLGQYFHINQGRGKNCKVEVYKRRDLDYFFAYPEDYSQAGIEWEDNTFSRRTHHPAFEIIFVYSQKAGTLDIYLSGDRKPVANLQEIFAGTILKASLSADEKDQSVYDLSCFRSRYVHFKYLPESGIQSVRVKKLRLALFDPDSKVTLEADPSTNPYAVYELLEKMLSDISSFNITQVGIKVTFHPVATGKRAKTCTFYLTWPNGCSLKYDEQSLIVRKMLGDSNIEPKLPESKTEPVPMVIDA